MIKYQKNFQNAPRKFFSLKRTTFLICPKIYWTLLNRFIYNKKIPSIPPLLVDGKIVSDFYEKSNIFNNFICINMYSNKKCKHLTILFVQNKHQNKVPLTLHKNILSIIKSLDPTNAHECGNLSIKMIHTCKEVITVPLKLIFGQLLKKGKFPEIQKAANVAPVHRSVQ